MTSHQESTMLTLLRRSRDMTIDGDVHVDANGPSELAQWIRVLTSPVTFAWRSEVTGERHLQLCGSTSQVPLRGRVTVVLDGDRHRELWDALLEQDLECGDEEPVGTGRLLQLARAA